MGSFFAMDFFFFDLDLEETFMKKNRRSLQLETKQGHLYHWLVAARRRRPGAPDHVQEPHQVGSVLDDAENANAKRRKNNLL